MPSFTGPAPDPAIPKSLEEKTREELSASEAVELLRKSHEMPLKGSESATFPAEKPRMALYSPGKAENAHSEPVIREIDPSLRAVAAFERYVERVTGRSTMNRDCHGDFYSIKGERFYRCLADGTVLQAELVQNECPACKRAVVRHPAQDHGEVATRTVSKFLVALPGFAEGQGVRWVTHSSRIVSEEFVPPKGETMAKERTVVLTIEVSTSVKIKDLKQIAREQLEAASGELRGEIRVKQVSAQVAQPASQ